MGSITERSSAKGKRYRAEIRIKRDGEIVHREAKTFPKRSHARTWMDRREAELEKVKDFTRYSIKDIIDEYVETYEKIQNWGRTKRTTLDFLRRRIGHWDASAVTSGQLVKYVTERRAEGAGGATVQNDLTWLKVAFKGMMALGKPVKLDQIDEAVLICRQQGLIERSGSRDRRPTEDELERLSGYFLHKDSGSDIPMHDIMWFAIHSSRRQAEITRIRWDDNDHGAMTGIVRDLKHPRKKIGNHRRFKYTQAAWDIAQRQPAGTDFIFPYNAKTVGAYWSRACKILEINDLRFHDLRHEGTSRLFETGYSIVEVQQFTLHENWDVLSRYTNLRPENVILR